MLTLIKTVTQRFSWLYKLEKKPRIIYQAVDFLKKDPKDFVINSQKKNIKIIKNMQIFAVIELDMSESKLFLVYQLTYKTKVLIASDFARKLTNDYANDQNKQNQIKFLKIHILKNYEKIDVPLVNLENSGKRTRLTDYMLRVIQVQKEIIS